MEKVVAGLRLCGAREEVAERLPVRGPVEDLTDVGGRGLSSDRRGQPRHVLREREIGGLESRLPEDVPEEVLQEVEPPARLPEGQGGAEQQLHLPFAQEVRLVRE